MADESRTTSLIRTINELNQNIGKHSFFNLLVHLERLFPQSKSLGEIGPPQAEEIRIRSTTSLAHPAADLESVRFNPQNAKIELISNFLGLLGVDSPLPQSLTEHLAFTDAHNTDQGRSRGLFDIFHQRLYSLLFRAWQIARPLNAKPDDDHIYDRFLACTGFCRSLKLGGDTRPSLREARLKVMRTRTAVGLAAIIEHQMGYPCTIKQMIARRIEVPKEQRSQLGKVNSKFGNLMLGKRVRDRNKIEIEIEAKDLAHWHRLLPDGLERQELDQVIARYLRDPIDYAINIKLPQQSTESWQLGRRGQALGQTLWLGKKKEHFSITWETTSDH